MSEIRDELESTIGKKATLVVFIIAALVGIYMIGALIFGIWPFSVVAGVVNKVTQPEAIIQNYEWFYDQYNSIKAQEANIIAMKRSNPDATEIVGMQMVLNNNIAEYNSRSKQITRNLWKANDLPYMIPSGEY